MSLIKSSQIDQPVNLSGSFIGEFSGSFSGSGAGLSDIPASAITGLNLSQISSGSVSASISPNNGLQVNTNVTATSFTGSLLGTASYASTALSSSFATTASYALTASYIEEYVTNSIYNTFTSSYYIDSASFNYRIENILIPTGSGSSENHPVTVNAATTTVLPRSPLYNNGTNGVGAFLSASISGTLGNIDGVTLTVGDHFLVKNQANSIQNGVYDVVSTGSASGFYLLSRSLFSDETSELDSQIVIPSFGTTNRGAIFAQTTNNPTIGTDNIIYSQQTNTLLTQTSAGTQDIYQIPWYNTVARQLSKGSKNFKYINVTSGTNITTSSLLLTGSFNISGSLNVTNGITGSLLGTSSYATTASYWSGSINNADSASFATTASYALNGGGTWGSIAGILSNQTDLQTALNGKVDENAAITGATKTKITYDSKGLVTVGSDASLAELTDDVNHRTVTDTQIATWNALIGGSVFQSVWNATTNIPALASGVGTKGYYYIVNVAGSTNLDGITDWKIGDWAIYDGTVWRKVDNTDAVSSVNSLTGAVSLDTSNIPDTLNKRYVTDAQLVVIGNTSGTNSGNETASTLGATINGASAAIPNDTDLVATAENAGLLKKITWTNVKAFLKTYFDTIYQTVLISGTSIKTINSTSLLGAGDISITPNATHTGEVTGTTALTVDKTAITNKTAVTIDTADYVLISDSSDSGNLKKGLVSDLGGFDDGDFTLVASFKSLYNY